jgi:solute carrier family 25 protein 16
MTHQTSPAATSPAGSAPAAAHSSSPSPSIAAQPKSQWEAISRALISGGLAGCVAKTVVAPLDRVKILFQGANSSVSQFSGSLMGPFKALKFIAENQGARGLYKGHQATLLRIFPYAALNYMCYEQYKRVRVRTRLRRCAHFDYR